MLALVPLIRLQHHRMDLEFRNMKIVYYLQRNLNDTYIILDDEESIFEEGKNTLNLYVTDNMEGFQRWIIDKMKPHMRKLRSPL